MSHPDSPVAAPVAAPAPAANPTTAPSGASLLADSLIALGAKAVYCVPGESFLPFLDALYDRGDRLRLVVCRQEGGAAYMAEAHGKLTGTPAVCVVTRGPGATNAAIGVHTAFQDATPMLLLIGQVARGMAGREAFQEVDMTAFFAPLAKFTATADSAARLPELITRAWAAATSGRPGPAVVALPEDVLAETIASAAGPVRPARPLSPARPAPRPADMRALAQHLSVAERPLVIVGGSTWTAAAARTVTQWAETWDLPVAAAFRRQDIIHNDCPIYVGELGFSVSPRLAARLREADLILALGARLGEVDTQGYTLLTSPHPAQTLIQVFPAAEELGRVYTPALGIVAAMEPFAEALGDYVADPPPEPSPDRSTWRARLRAEYEANRVPDPCPGGVDMGQVMTYLDQRLPKEVIITNGAGNYSGWPQRFLRYRRFPSQLAPGNGSMGYGVPAAIAAKVACPDRMVVGFAGDGCFLMTGQELATAVQLGVDPILIVLNNGMFGTIRMHQERTFPGRVIGTDLSNPDFAALARAYGAMGFTVTRTQDFPLFFEQAIAARRAAVLEVRLDPEAVTTRTTLSALRNRAG